jgi:polysaccharide biosynthesis protein PslE
MAIVEHRMVETRDYALLQAGGVRPSLPSMREALGALFKNRGRILKAMAITFGAFLVLAILVSPRYAAHASLLVNSGTEYTVRPEAGQQTVVNQVAEHDQILGTEAEILQSRELQEAVVRKIGIDRLYPAYARPSLFRTVRLAVSDSVRTVQGLFVKVPPRPTAGDDPVRLAVEYDFSRNLNVAPQRIGNVIELTFRHRDPELAALALNTLVADYLDYRQRLYADVQTPRVMQQLSEVTLELEGSDSKLRTFKEENGISNFTTQIDILLHREGQLASDQQDADNIVKQLTSRLADVREQLSITPEQVTESSDMNIETIQAGLDKLRAREVEMREHYLPDSAPMVEIRQQIANGDAEVERMRTERTPLTVRTSRSHTFDAVDLDRAKSEADLNSARARLQRDNQQLAELRAQVQHLNESETQLEALQRERAVAEETFRSLTKTYEDRKLIEAVNARQVTTVRAVQKAEVPLESTGLRKLLLFAGVVASLMVGMAFAALLEYGRPAYLSPEAVERSLGVPVLATIADSAGRPVASGSATF